MLAFAQALDLLKKYNLDPNRVAHSQAVSAFAFELAQKIHNRHPFLDLDPEKVRIAALLHDIGRSRGGDHEINSVTILRSEGLHDIAAIAMHGSMYELSVLRGSPNPVLLPQSLENKIVTYADARCKDHVVTLQERFLEIQVRRSAETDKVASVKMAAVRYFVIEREILAMLVL